ncbi:MAG: T9SS type A sorting domain-containing protein [bacterium]
MNRAGLSKTLFSCLAGLLPLQIHAQHLVVGFTDPNEVVVIRDATVQHDTVLVMNNGSLIIDNADFTANQALIIRHSGSLIVENSNFIVNGKCIFFENGSATLKDNLTFRGDIFDLGNASLEIDSAEVSIPMTFVGQVRFIGADSAEFRINSSTFNLGSGKLGGGFSGQSKLTQLNTSYQSQVGIAMTIGVGGQAAIMVDNCTGGMELVISDSADVDIRNSTGFILWHTLVENSQASMAFPPPNSVVPNASDVSSYTFSDALPGVSGIHYKIAVQNTNVVFWALLPDATSDVTVKNSTVLACGFRYRGAAQDTVSGFINDSSYVSFTAPLSDRSFNLNHSIVKAWNFYPQDNARLVIRNSVFGEALTFHQSMLTVENSVCDGAGGFFGASQNSEIQVRNSIIKRIGAGPDIILNRGASKVVLEESTVIGTVVINNTSRLIYANVNLDHEPVLHDAAFFVESSLDSVLTRDDTEIAPITGTLRSAQGQQNLDAISSFKIAYSNPDSSNRTLIADVTYTGAVVDGVLHEWNTQGLTAGEYLLWITPFVNGDSLTTSALKVTLSTVTAIKEQHGVPVTFALQQNYPNPFNPETTIRFSLPQRAHVTLKVFDLLGRELATLVDDELQAGGHLAVFDANALSSGVYFYRMTAGHFSQSRKAILMK